MSTKSTKSTSSNRRGESTTPKPKPKPGRKRLTTEPVKKITVTLTHEAIATAKRLGGENKNISQGIRAALEQAKETP